MLFISLCVSVSLSLCLSAFLSRPSQFRFSSRNLFMLANYLLGSYHLCSQCSWKRMQSPVSTSIFRRTQMCLDCVICPSQNQLLWPRMWSTVILQPHSWCLLHELEVRCGWRLLVDTAWEGKDASSKGRGKKERRKSYKLPLHCISRLGLKAEKLQD